MRKILRCLLVLATLAAYTVPAQAQIPSLKSAKKKAEEALKKASADTAKKAQEDSPAEADASKPAGGAAPAAGASAKADPKVWENYDFVPGNKVIFYTDFSEDKVGNFARGLKYESGPAEVVERDGVKMLRFTGRSTIHIPVAKVLPERFTLEVDIIAPSDQHELITFEGGREVDR